MKGELKKFAERMVDDHSNAGDELKTTAQNLGYAPSEKMAHQKAVALFRKEASSGQSPELKEFAGKTLPVLEEHLKMAMSLPYAKDVAQKMEQRKSGSRQ